MPTPINNRKTLLGFQKSYAFLIGINNYPRINAHLQSAVNDAKALAQVLKHQQGFDHVELLVETTPDIDETREAEKQAKLKDGLDGIVVQFSASGATFRNLLARIQDPEQAPKINPHDCIVFYYAGHGKPGEFDEGPAGYLLPSDTRPDVAKLKNDSLLPMEAVFEALKVLDCHHTLLILDCCFAGKFRQASKSRETGWITNLPLYEERFMRYKRERAWQVLVSAGPHQTAADWLGERQELNENDHSPFAQALLDALAGKAELSAAGKKLGDGVLTSQELFLYLWDKVERLTNTGQLGKNSQYPDLFPMSNHQGGQFIFFDPNNKLNFAERTLRNPYQGLKPFETSESDLFFGRQAILKTLLPRLLTQPLLVITAPSGSGKSSLVKAGLFPALTNWQNEAGETPWVEAELLVLRPGAKPWSGEPQYPKDGTDQNNIIYTGLRALLPQLQKDKKQVLLIDQYEELFTDGATEEERTFFENELRDRYRQAHERQLKIIITLRSDYEWLLEESTFGKVFWQQDQLTQFLYRLPSMQLNELREALVNPALAELYEFETEKLVENILAEIGHAPGALSMLSFTMSQFYELTDKDTRVFTSTTYKKLGGVNGALSKYADGIYAALEPDEQDIMKKLLIRMVRFSDGRYGRRRVYVRPAQHTEELQEGASANAIIRPAHQAEFLNEFDYPDHQDALVLEVLELLEDRQLLLVGGDNIGRYYEPVHDMLIQQWKTAKQWIAQFGTENIALQRDLWQAVQDNSQPKKRHNKVQTTDFSKLWDNNHKLLQVLAQIASAAKAYFLAEQEMILNQLLPQLAERDREGFQKIWKTFLQEQEVPDLNALILSNCSHQLLDIFLENGNHWLNEAEADFVRQSWNKRIADILEIKRRMLRAEVLAMSATARSLPRKEMWKALRIAQAAYERTPNPLPIASKTLASLYYSQFGGKGKARMPLPLVNTTPSFLSGAPSFAVFTPDGKGIIINTLLSHNKEHQLRSMNGDLLATLSTEGDPISAHSFSPESGLMYTLSQSGNLKKWDLSSGDLLDTISNADHFTGAVLSPDGQHLITLIEKQLPQVWTVAGEFVTELAGPDEPKKYAKPVHQIYFSADGQYLVNQHSSGMAWLQQIDGTLIKDLSSSEKGKVENVFFLPQSDHFILVSTKKTFSPYGQLQSSTTTTQLYNGQGEPQGDILLQDQAINTLSFSPDGQYFVVKTSKGAAGLYSIDGTLLTDAITYASNQQFAAIPFSPSSTHLVVIDSSTTAKIWTTKGEEGPSMDLHSRGINSLKISPDGRYLLTASDDGTAKVWDWQGKLVADLNAHTMTEGDVTISSSVKSAEFSPDSKMIVTASNDGSVKIWNLHGPLLRHLEVKFGRSAGSPSLAISFLPGGNDFQCNFGNQPPRIWGWNGEPVKDLELPASAAMVYSPDGQYVLTIGRPPTLWTQGANEGIRLKKSITGIESGLFNLMKKEVLINDSRNNAYRFDFRGAFLGQLRGKVADCSPDGQALLIINSARVHVHHFNESPPYTFEVQGGGANTARFSADGEHILIAYQNKTAKLWQIHSPSEPQEFEHTDIVYTAGFSPDDQQVVTASRDGTAKIWSCQGALIADFDRHDSGIKAATFSPDGQFVLTASYFDHSLKLWPTPERIYQWLKNEATIPELTEKLQQQYNID